MFFAVAVCLSVVLVCDGTDGREINMEIEDASSSSSSGSCCSNQHSKVYQSDQVFGSEVLNGSRSIDISMTAECMENTTCTATWLRPNPSSNCTSCECGSSLGGLVECDSSSEKVSLLQCYCMTFSIDESMLVVGLCVYTCVRRFRYPLASNTSQLDELCSRYNREGQLCGRCKDGFALPVYSYNFSCISCESHYAYNWVKYVAASFFPLTLFFIVIVTFRVRVTSGHMNAFLLMSQTISLPALSRELLLEYEHQCISGSINFYTGAVYVLISFYGIWNLDFFRLLYPTFCLHPKISAT